MSFDLKSIDDYKCFVSAEEWDTLSTAQKCELIALCRMDGEQIAQALEPVEEELYYKAVVEE